MKNNQQQTKEGLNINWFPGHMKKGTDEIVKTSKYADLIIEVLDARALSSSDNSELLNVINNKPILKIGLKSDYCDLKSYPNDMIVGSTKDYKFRNVIINKINAVLQNKIDHYRKKGLINPKFCILVLGLPNIGKSSLINFLKAKNTLIVKNMPGVTRNQSTVTINNTLSLIDTPGILVKNISDISTAYKLVLINCIRKEILTLEPVLEFGFQHFQKNHYSELLKYYGLTSVSDYHDFMLQVCNKNKWYLSNNQLDINRFETQVFNDFSQCKICKTHFD